MFYALCTPSQEELIRQWNIQALSAEALPREILFSAVSGGSFWGHLLDEKKSLGHPPAVYLERVRMDFPLPCPEGTGRTLDRREWEALSPGKNVFFSRELCAKYFTFCRGCDIHFVLFDDGETFRQKVAQSRRAGVQEFYFSWQDWADEMKKTPDIFCQVFSSH